MDKEGGMRAVKGLDGHHLTGSPKPLSVQPYVSGSDTVQNFIACYVLSLCRRGPQSPPHSKPS